MAFELYWLKRASNKLDTIHQYYSEFASEQVAKRRIGKIIHSVDRLQTMPYYEEFTRIRSYRYLVVLTYKVYYFVEDDGIYIASIWDCRQGGRAFI